MGSIYLLGGGLYVRYARSTIKLIILAGWRVSHFKGCALDCYFEVVDPHFAFTGEDSAQGYLLCDGGVEWQRDFALSPIRSSSYATVTHVVESFVGVDSHP